MRFSTFLAALLPATAVMGAEWVITVGAGGNLTFTPDSINATVGDTVVFQFVAKNHTATQSSFATPCTNLNSTSFDTGFQDVGNTTNFLNSTVLTVNDTNPVWFYCRQTVPVSHCAMGMVFAINPTANKTFAAFQSNAKATNASSNSTTTSSSSSGSSAPSPTQSNTNTNGAMKMDATAGILMSGVGIVAGLLL